MTSKTILRWSGTKNITYKKSGKNIVKHTKRFKQTTLDAYQHLTTLNKMEFYFTLFYCFIFPFFWKWFWRISVTYAEYNFFPATSADKLFFLKTYFFFFFFFFFFKWNRMIFILKKFLFFKYSYQVFLILALKQLLTGKLTNVILNYSWIKNSLFKLQK